ncbi:MAG: RES domain-containing protein [Candidatus Limnocylindria bacterium]
MSLDIEAVAIGRDVYRVARGPDAFALPSWEYANTADGTFGGRYDDLLGEYRVLYVCVSRAGAFSETLAALRPRIDVREAIEAIADGEADRSAAGIVPARWLEGRVAGDARAAGLFADVGHSRTIGSLRAELATAAAEVGLDDFDAATIRLSAPRRLTQLISRLIYDESQADGSPRFAGIAYGSRLGDELTNLAIFERPDSEPPMSGMRSAGIASDDADLAAALELLGLTLD